MILDWFKCPPCGSTLRYGKTPVEEPFFCLTRGERLKIKLFYRNEVSIASLPLAGVFSFAIGLPGVLLLTAALLLWLPVLAVSRIVIDFVVPLRIERY